MSISFFALRYSFICPSGDCNHQFDVSLRELVKVDHVTCPRCSTAIDIRRSKTEGDLAQIFREGMSMQASPKLRRKSE